MLKRWLWLATEDLKVELVQLEEEGRDLSTVKRRFAGLIRLGDKRLQDPRQQDRASELLDECAKLKMRKGYPYNEPSDLASIRPLRPRGTRKYGKSHNDKVLLDRITGAWLGRCVGCFLGKPVETQKTETLWGFLKLTRQWPLNDYIRFDVRGKAKEKYADLVNAKRRFDKINFMPIDDDTNYTTIGLRIVQHYGPDFTSSDVGDFWSWNLPILSTCTAERVAYRNVALQLEPPDTATYRNPYREWIGAQIRADAFGYLNAGNPERAAEFAWRDASLSHVKNGIYGEMLMAAMIAAAPYAESIETMIKVGLAQIPATSRLYETIMEVIGWYQEGIQFNEIVERIHEKWDEYSAHDWCHTISNAAVCVVALLWGEEDFGRSVCYAVQPCFDTDCNGATVGSILGMRLGAEALPSRWTDRLNNTLRTAIRGFHEVEITRMAEDTFKLFKEIR
jgi:ADP-ribosylglycohydrolase